MKKMKLQAMLILAFTLAINSVHASPEVVVESGPQEPPAPIDNIIILFLLLGIVFAYFILKSNYKRLR